MSKDSKEEKINKVSSFNSRLDAAKAEKINGGIHALDEDDDVLGTKTIRLTNSEWEGMEKWCKELNDKTNKKGRGYTRGTLVRALYHMKDDISETKLIKALRDVG
jgi:hypothetical protein